MEYRKHWSIKPVFEADSTIIDTSDDEALKINKRFVPSAWGYTSLNNTNLFEFINGLWTGKTSPFVRAKILRNTNFTNDGKLDFSNVAELDVEAKAFAGKRLYPGDIIIERSGGGPKQPVGRVVYF